MWNEQPLGMKERAEIDVIRRITPRVPPTNFAQLGDALEPGRDFEADSFLTVSRPKRKTTGLAFR